MSAEKTAGLSGSHPVTMPIRQASVETTMSDEAVPSSDPKDVSLPLPRVYSLYFMDGG
jgi:hypothetical protein